MEPHDDICDVSGILVGHDTLLDAATGCTVVFCATPAVGAVDVRGGAPATREVALLAPERMMREVHAITLSGGSAFGLEAATGVARALEARGIGYDVGVARVPIVPAASLFDLSIGGVNIRPDAESGIRALNAATNGPVAQGSVGAGAGATVGKAAGLEWAVKSGLGSASMRLDTPTGSFTVGALVAVNALGDIYDPDNGQIIAGARHPSGRGWLRMQTPPQTEDSVSILGGNTTLAVVATDSPLNKSDLTRIAQMAHDGYALTIRPTHTPFDGDIVFTLSTGTGAAEAGATSPMMVTQLGALAAQVVARSIIRAIHSATTLAGVPALRDLTF